MIDPGYDPDPIIDAIERGHLRVVRILCTHGHFDHISGVNRLRQHTGAPFFISREDAELCAHPPADPAEFLGYEVDPTPVDGILRDGDEISVGTLRFRVIATPGHSPGGVCLLCGEALFAGDTLFAGGVGRTDLPGGDWDQLMQSIRERLLTLSDDLAVYPGHGPPTTLGAERRTNPFL